MIAPAIAASCQSATESEAQSQDAKPSGTANAQPFENFLNAEKDSSRSSAATGTQAASPTPATTASTPPASRSSVPPRKITSKSDASTKQAPSPSPDALAAAVASIVQPVPSTKPTTTPISTDPSVASAPGAASDALPATGVPTIPSAPVPATAPAPGLSSSAQPAATNTLPTQSTQPTLPAQPTQPTLPTQPVPPAAAPAFQAAQTTPQLPQTPTAPIQPSTAGLQAYAQARAVGTAGGIKSRSAEFAAPRTASPAKTSARAALEASSSPDVRDYTTIAAIGTTGAKQNRAMAIQAQLQGSDVTFKGNAPASTQVERPSQSPAQAPARPVAAQPQSASQQPAAGVSQSPAFAVPAATTFAGTATASTSSPATASSNQLATATLNQVLESADKMTSDGKTSVQVQVKLDDGQQLTVRLQMSQGSVHPIFKTESPELRQAIEQNWSGFRSAASDRGLEIATPVFESPNSGGSFNPYGNRDQSRQSAGDQSDAEGFQTFSQPGSQSGGNASATPSQAAPSTGSSVQMYA